MYTIVLDPRTPDSQPVVIDNDYPNERSHKTISPQLELEENAFGSLSFTLPCQNEYYELFDTAALSQAEVRVYHTGESEPVFRGRLLEVKRDSQMNRNVMFEGELAYLADSVQEPAEYKDVTPEYYVGKLLAVHNKKFPSQQFALGRVTVKDNDTADHITGVVNRGSYSTDYTSSTWSCLQSLVSELGGFLSVRWSNGTRYLDYLKDHPDDCNQTIDLGENLLDYAEEWSLAELYTVVVPLGASIDTGETNEKGNTIKSKLTIASVNGGKVYCEDRADIIARYGRREKAIEFSGIQDPYHLLQIAILYLNNIQFDNMVLSLTALDLSELGQDVDRFKLHSVVHANAAPFGLVDKTFPITKISLPLKDPAHAVYSMSTNTKGIHSLSEKITDIVDELTDEIDDAKKEAKELPKYSASEAGTPDDWIFGIPKIVYRIGERGSKYLYHGDFVLRVWDSTYASANMVKESIENNNGEMQPVCTAWPEAWLEEGDVDMGIIHGDMSGVWDDVSTLSGDEAKQPWGNAIVFNKYTAGKIPVNIEYGSPSSYVFYAVVRFRGYSDTNDGTIGYHQSSSWVTYGVDNNGALCTVNNGTKTPLMTTSGGISVYDRPVVFAFMRNIITTEDHPASTNLVVGLQPSTGDLSSRVYGSFVDPPSGIGMNHGICINYNYDSSSPFTGTIEHDHTVEVVRIIECYSPVTGQITLDEVYENVAWLVGRFITGTIKSDSDKLPGQSTPEPEPEPEEEEGES